VLKFDRSRRKERGLSKQKRREENGLACAENQKNGATNKRKIDKFSL